MNPIVDRAYRLESLLRILSLAVDGQQIAGKSLTDCGGGAVIDTHNKTPEVKMSENPDQIDIHVGSALRTLRHNAGMSQHALAEAMGVRFQQVQKYETGKNRISASRLKHAADAIGVSVSVFFRGLQDDDRENDVAAILSDAEALEIARSIRELPEQARKGLRSVIATMAWRPA